MAKLTDEKDLACWETLSAFHIIKRDGLVDRGELAEGQDTIVGVEKEWELAATSDDKGVLAEFALTRCGVERYMFAPNGEEQAIIARANNTQQELGSMLHIAAVLIKNPQIEWK